MRAKIAYWVYNYAPQWEAASKEVNTLMQAYSTRYDTRLFAQNQKFRRLDLKGPQKIFPLPYSLLAAPFLGRIAGSFDINHIFASPTEPLLLRRLDPHTTILTITKDTESLSKLEKNVRHLKRLRYIAVESEWHKELLYQAGINSDRVKLIYPGSRVKPYRPAEGPFKILFATSPLDDSLFLSRGVFLLLKAAARLPEVTFVFTWREKDYSKLQRYIDQENLANVEVRNGYIPDMDSVYQSVHATVLPGLTTSSLKPTPHSGLDSLSHGKPVLVSQPSSISALVERQQCGVVFEPTVDSLVESVHRLVAGYELYQSSTHATIQNCFSEDVLLECYGQLYETMLAAPEAPGQPQAQE
jgi:glycosyltransferase involved in cell wall biosynthesis